jgi:hypothetical protein
MANYRQSSGPQRKSKLRQRRRFLIVSEDTGREQLYALLKAKSRLGKVFEKGDASIYAALEAKQPDALRWSKKLLFVAQQECAQCPGRVNPSTNVHELVDRLNKLGQFPLD